jgi:hypothetical protein
MNVSLPVSAIRALKDMQSRWHERFGTRPSYKDIASRAIIEANEKEARR